MSAGFCIELIQRLAEQLHFNYTFEMQADGQYGKYDPVSKTWNGILGRIIDEPEVIYCFYPIYKFSLFIVILFEWYDEISSFWTTV